MCRVLATFVLWCCILEMPQVLSTKVLSNRPLCPCGKIRDKSPSETGRIVGGHNAAKSDYPYAVGLMNLAALKDTTTRPYCGATLISESFVLTAAHCVQNQNMSDFLVHVGGYDYTRPFQGKLFRPKSVTVPKGYIKGQYYDDIALIRLKEAVDFEALNVRAAVLPPPNVLLLPGVKVTAYGWGLLKFNKRNGTQPSVLQAVDLPVVGNEVCQKDFDTIIKSYMMCAGGMPGMDSCRGDSGGGLVTKIANEDVLCGIVSFGKKCAVTGVPGVYTQVSVFTKWIIQGTRVSKCSPCIYRL